MSASLYVSCQRAVLPTRDAWQAALKAAKFDLLLGEVQWSKQTGFLGAKFRSRPTGFEMIVEDAKPVAKALGIKLPAEHDVVVSFAFGSDMDECHAATAASACLAKCTKGVYFDEYSDEQLDGDTAISIAQDSIEAD
jgi:hypothetical protein